MSFWLWKRFKNVVVSEVPTSQDLDYGYVFVFWLQGEHKAPPIVKACISSVRKWCSDRNVVVLDKENYSKYVSLPECLLRKYECGGVSHAHFSDVLRFELLREHGGIWVDATDFISMPLPNYVFEYTFFSLNGAYSDDLVWKWTSWFMVAQKGDLLVENMCRFYEIYWKKYDSAITYLFLDCWVLALYNHIPSIKNNIDALPDCKGKCYSIASNWNKLYSEEYYQHLMSCFFVNKLTYKGSLPPIEKDGVLTVFGKLLKYIKYDC